MEIPLENRMLHAIEAEDLKLVAKLLSKGANPNKIVSNGKTCLGEAAFRGLTDIGMLLIAESCSDKQAMSEDEADEVVDDCVTKNRKKEASVQPVKKKLDMSSIYSKYTTERAGKQTGFKERSSENFHRLDQPTSQSSSSEDSKVPLSPQSDLEWDEDMGEAAANTKEDDVMTEMYKWYASILETTGAAVMAASDLTYGIDQEDAFGKTALSYACDRNNFDIFKALVDADCKIDATNSQTGWTVLHSACTNNRLEFVKLLLEAGSDVNLRNPTKATPLHLAACHTIEMVTVIVEFGATLDLRDDQDRTPLFIAASEGNGDIVDYLIARGAQMNLEDMHGHTPLCLAVKYNHINTAELLLLNGIIVKHFQCLLHTAVIQDKYDMVRLLATFSCGLNVHNFVGETPLLVAMAIEQPIPFITLLLQKGANVNAHNSHSGTTPLHLAVEVFGEPKEFEFLLNVFIDCSVRIDKRAFTRDTALNRAILLHRDRNAMQLIRYGADVNLCEVLPDISGNLIIASNRKTNKLANMLIKAGHKYIRLNTEHSSTTVNWINEICKAPLSLANICRIRIRNMRNKINLRDFVRALPIPELMQNFLMMNELFYDYDM